MHDRRQALAQIILRLLSEQRSAVRSHSVPEWSLTGQLLMSASHGSLRGSSCTGQGFEEAVARAMDRMGFTVESNILLNSTTGLPADQTLRQRWVRHILAKEVRRGNDEPWKEQFGRATPRRQDWANRPNVTEVDLVATLDPAVQPPGDEFCGFTCEGNKLTVRTFCERLQGRTWLIEISGPSGNSMRKRDKTRQLQSLSKHAARANPPAGVALFYNGSDCNAPPPVQGPVSSDIVMMHFLEKIVLELPEKLKDQELQVRDQLLQATILERQRKDQLLQATILERQRKDQLLQRKDQELLERDLERREQNQLLQRKDQELQQFKIAILTLVVCFTAVLARAYVQLPP